VTSEPRLLRHNSAEVLLAADQLAGLFGDQLYLSFTRRPILRREIEKIRQFLADESAATAIVLSVRY
jgi:hypothetical protein